MDHSRMRAVRTDRRKSNIPEVWTSCDSVDFGAFNHCSHRSGPKPAMSEAE